MRQEEQKLSRHGFRMIIREYISRALVLLLLLVSSGDFGWHRAWLLFWMMLAMNLIFHLVVVIPVPDLYNERGKIAPNTEAWDRKILAIFAMTGYLAVIVMGLDKRFGWSFIGQHWIIPGAVLIGLSFGLSAWAMRVNHYFSSVVRIQADRGQVVVDRGPYSVIRHPGYFSIFLFYIGVPLVLGSAVGFFYLPVVAGLFAYRTLREEQTLTAKLDGYKEYRDRVRYRLLPGIW